MSKEATLTEPAAEPTTDNPRLRLASRSDTAVLQSKLDYRKQLRRYMSECDADKLLSAQPGEFPDVEIRPEDLGRVLGILYRRNAEARAS